MGSKNVATKKYTGHNDIFADICNFVLYNGEPVIRPEELFKTDVTELGIPFTDKGKIMIERIRDVLKLCTVKNTKSNTYIIIGIENQSDVHYAMVVRNMLQDALNYVSQVEKHEKNHRESKDLIGTEFLSGFSKEDKLMPVVTITVYWNSGDWDGPRTLHDMLYVEDENILKYIPDYKMNLIVPNEICDFSKFKTELQDVFKFLHNGNDKELLRKMVNNPDFDLSRDAVEVLNSCANIGIKISEQKGEKVKMCEGWEALKREVIEEATAEGLAKGHAEGLAKGHAEGLAKGHAEGLAEGAAYKLLSMIEVFMSKNSVSLDNALESLSVSEEEYINARNIIG